MQSCRKTHKIRFVAYGGDAQFDGTRRRRARASGSSHFRIQAMSRRYCAGIEFRSFRRIRLKRISTFRTLAARSPHALMLLGGMKFVRRTHVASLFGSPLPGLLRWRFCPACEDRPMRLLVLVIVISLGAGPTLAQTNIGGSSAAGAAPGSPDGNPTSLNHRLPSGAVPPAEDPQRSSLRPQPNLHDSAVADCRGMWDAGTHMTKQQWSNTCKRIQTRLDNLDVEAIMPKAKTQVR
jgi:hypothetical protein